MGFLDILKKGISIGRPLLIDHASRARRHLLTYAVAVPAAGGAAYAATNDVGVVDRVRETGLLAAVWLEPKDDEGNGVGEESAVKVVRA